MCGFTSSCACALSYQGLLSVDSFYSIQWILQWTAKTLIRLRWCAVWSGPSLCAHAPKAHFPLITEAIIYEGGIHLVDFLPFYTTETTFLTSCLPSCAPIPFLNLSSLQTNTDTFANSADPDETAPTKRLIRNRHCLPFSVIETKTPICNNWCVQIQIWKSLF